MNMYIANWEAPVVFHNFGTNLIKQGFTVKTTYVEQVSGKPVMKMVATRANQIAMIGVGVTIKYVGIGFALEGEKDLRAFQDFTNMAKASLFIEEQLKLMEEWK